jgi:DNA-binding transcriptional MocR family regulator
VLVKSLGEELGPAIDITGAEAGMHLSLSLRGIHDREIAKRAAQQKLWVAPLSSSYIEKPLRQGFILGFGSTAVEEIPRAVRKLRTAVGT